MSDWIQSVCSTDSSQLADLFLLGADVKCTSVEDFQESLHHLLGVPIANAINQLPESLADRMRARAGELKLRQLCTREGIATFGDLMRQPKPPLELLEFAKEFGKRLGKAKLNTWPAEVGAVLYYLAIGIALLRTGERISELSLEDLRRGFERIGRFAWLDGHSRSVIEAVLHRLPSQARLAREGALRD